MKLPVITGTIRRRFLLNFRVRPEVMREVLPPPFEPKLHAGWGMAGICLIRLEGIRPKWLPIPMGIRSENAAHRFAVTWKEEGAGKEGVYIPRRDTSSRLNHIAGGRLFPGVHHLAAFKVLESEDAVNFEMRSTDGEVSVRFSGHHTDRFPGSSVFTSVREASGFFEAGSLGYSDTAEHTRYDGLLLQTDQWKVSPFAVDQVFSSYFENARIFPEGSAEFDHALYMENIPHEWHAAKDLFAGGER